MTDYDAFESHCSRPERTSPPNGPNRPRAEHPAVASSFDRLSQKLRNYGEQETNIIKQVLNVNEHELKYTNGQIFASCEMRFFVGEPVRTKNPAIKTSRAIRANTNEWNKKEKQTETEAASSTPRIYTRYSVLVPQ